MVESVILIQSLISVMKSENKKGVPPDGGWGWIVVASAGLHDVIFYLSSDRISFMLSDQRNKTNLF